MEKVKEELEKCKCGDECHCHEDKSDCNCGDDCKCDEKRHVNAKVASKTVKVNGGMQTIDLIMFVVLIAYTIYYAISLVMGLFKLDLSFGVVVSFLYSVAYIAYLWVLFLYTQMKSPLFKKICIFGFIGLLVLLVFNYMIASYPFMKVLELLLGESVLAILMLMTVREK